jgi:hypothetical protein
MGLQNVRDVLPLKNDMITISNINGALNLSGQIMFCLCLDMLDSVHRGLNRFHRGHAAYIPYILTRDVTTNIFKPLPLLFQA